MGDPNRGWVTVAAALSQVSTKTHEFEAANSKDPPKDSRERSTIGMWYGVMAYFLHKIVMEGDARRE